MLKLSSFLALLALSSLSSAHYSRGPGSSSIAQHSNQHSTIQRKHKQQHAAQQQHKYNAAAPGQAINLTSGGSSGNSTRKLAKRGGGGGSNNGRATFYGATGRGACGSMISPGDYVVAMNAAQYGDMSAVSSWCYQTITITYGKKSHTATVVDACPHCPSGGLDMSPALFDYFASESVGVFYMSWSSGDSAEQTTTTTTSKTTTTTTTTSTTTTTTPPPPPTTTYVAPTTTTLLSASVTVAILPSASVVSFINSTMVTLPLSTSTNATASLSGSGLPLSAIQTASSTISLGASSAAAASSSVPDTVAPKVDVGGALDSLAQLVLAYGELVAANAAAHSA